MVAKNDAVVRGGRGGQKVMIEIVVSENDKNDGQPLTNISCIHVSH